MVLNRRKFVKAVSGLFVPTTFAILKPKAKAQAATDLPFLGGGSGASTLKNGLVSYWILGEATGATRVDSMGTSNFADINSNVGGNISTLLGGHDVDLQPTSVTKILRAGDTPYRIGAGKSFTLNFWIQYVPTAGVPLVGKWPNAGQAEWLLYDLGTPPTWNAFRNSDNTQMAYTLTGFLNTGVWQMITLGYDDSTGNLFAIVSNGTPQTLACAGGVHTGTNPLTIGAWSNAGTGGQSKLQDMGFWSRVLTPPEITRLYNSGAGVPFSSF